MSRRIMFGACVDCGNAAHECECDERREPVPTAPPREVVVTGAADTRLRWGVDVALPTGKTSVRYSISTLVEGRRIQLTLRDLADLNDAIIRVHEISCCTRCAHLGTLRDATRCPHCGAGAV